MSFPNRDKSTKFVASIVEHYQSFGPFDGMDWNTFEADQVPDTAEMIWISLQLKQRYPGFLITAPPAPGTNGTRPSARRWSWRGRWTMRRRSITTAPVSPRRLTSPRASPSGRRCSGASHVVVGFGIWDQPNYMKIGDAVSTWKALDGSLPTLRGVFNWQIHTDEEQGWPFAKQLAPLVP